MLLIYQNRIKFVNILIIIRMHSNKNLQREVSSHNGQTLDY